MRKFYADSPFVRVFPAGKLPQIQYSLHTNNCDVGFTLAPDGKRLVIISCLDNRSEEHTSELQSQSNLVCRLLLEKKKKKKQRQNDRITNPLNASLDTSSIQP